MVLAASLVESMTLGLSVWGSAIAVGGGVAGFVALLCGRVFREIERQFVYGSVAAAPCGFLLCIATVILASG